MLAEINLTHWVTFSDMVMFQLGLSENVGYIPNDIAI